MEESNIASLQDAIGKSLVELTRTTAQLASEDLAFFRVSHPKEAKQLARSSGRILALSRRLLQTAAAETNVTAPTFSDVETLEDSWPSLVEVIDNLLEKTDVTLDEVSGVRKRQDPENEAPAKLREQPLLKTSSKISKPQLLFRRKPQNYPLGAFKPLLSEKPHARVPLSASFPILTVPGSEESYDAQFYLCIKDCSPLKHHVDENLRFKHPYESELNAYQYPAWVRSRQDPIVFTPFDDTEPKFVDTLETLAEMIDELKQATEIAVDLEHHDRHSYVGMVSLMQISTRDKDWIIDTLQPWRDELQLLNQVFADPSILKVFHGSTRDIIWLQRDFGVYVVGLFDTYHACKALNYQGRSLAFLLSKFANVTAQKQFQLADWRIRPLPQELLDYARADTHYLLYIYDNMRNELIGQSQTLRAEEDLLDQVLEGSKRECLQKYEHFHYDEVRGTGRDGWYQLLIRTPALFTRQQFSVFRAVHRWRDRVARDEDEGINTVMQKHTLFDVARQMPTTPKDLHLAVSSMSDQLRNRVDELCRVIAEAVKAGENGPEMQKYMDEHPETIAYQARQAERIRAREVAQQGGFAVGDVIRRERENAEKDRTPLNNLLSRNSTFWGPTVVSRVPSSATPVDTAPRLQIPLPPQIREVDTNDLQYGLAEDESHTNDSSAIDMETMELANKRKNPTSNNYGPFASTNAQVTSSRVSMSSQSPDPMLSDVVALASDGVEERRAAKRARRAARKVSEDQQHTTQDETPYDYGSAPSVLHAKPGRPAQMAVDPYAKAMDASRGARQEKRELPGKSMTFYK